MRKILIANIFGIGDVLFTTPLIANLKKSIKGVSVDYLCNARTRPLLEMTRDVDDIFVYEKDSFVELWKKSRLNCLRALYELFSGVRRGKYDAVFDFTLTRKFGLFFKLAGIPRRIGLDYKRRGLFLTDRMTFSGFEGRHVVEYYLDLLGKLNVPVSERHMKLVPDEKRARQVVSSLEEKTTGGNPLVGVIPGGGASWGFHASRKRWSAEGFAGAADILSERGITVVVIGDDSESGLCREVADKMKGTPVAVENSLSLEDYIALLSRCELVLCNDGGPLHIAVALGVNTVSIFGPVDEKVYGPYPASDRHRVITAKGAACRPCYNRFKLPECGHDNVCFESIAPEDVAETCLSLLGL